MTTSNFRAMRNSKSQAHWKRLHKRGFEHIEVSDEGKVRHAQTGTIYSTSSDGPGKRNYVMLAASKVFGGGAKQFAVDKLVYETFYNCELPPRVMPEHVNGDLTDNRLVNLKVDERIHVASVPVVKHVELPTVKPDTAPKIVQKPVEVDRQAEMAARYQARMDDLHLLLTGCDEWQSVDDLLRIGIQESEWLYLLKEYLSAEEMRDVVLQLVRLLVEKGG